MVKLSELVFDSNVFPLRIIDLDATLRSGGGVCFEVPSDWNFHAISHTWSQDIRDLSVAVANLLLHTGWSTDQDLYERGLSYNKAFAEPRFAHNPCFLKLMQFFEIVRGDGATKVWFDALCINQKDDDEKAHEIRHMGGYYRLSAGCYVITHGIGTELGFKAAATDSKDPVPRWFSRAWTIQESILPERLSFIVEKFDGESMIKKWYQKGQFLWELSEQWRDWDEPLEPNVEWGIQKRTGDISRRRAYKEFYCLGAEAYRRMMQIALHPAWQWSDFVKAFSELGDGSDSIEVESVVELVQRRHCSVEEDRVLSILGMLGIAGEHQLRTKQTLDQQLVWLAKTLMKENPKLLINLSTADFEGYMVRCISWLPNLRYAEHRRFLYPGQEQYKSFVVDRHVARVKSVQDDGKIVLSTRMLRGKLIIRGNSFRLQIGGREVELSGYHTQQPCLLSLEKKSTLASDSSVRRSGGFSIPAHRIDELDHFSRREPLFICEITLLMLGYCHPCDYPYTLAMACIGTTKEMQKVGILGFPPSEELDFSSCFEDCVIGGFGDDLTSLLSPECQAVLQQTGNLSTSPLDNFLSQCSEEDLAALIQEMSKTLSLHPSL